MRKIAYLFIVLAVGVLAMACQEEVDSTLVGKWKVVDYSDDVKRDAAGEQQFLKEIEIVKTMTLELNADGTYSRRRGLEAETGEWKLSKSGNTLITKPFDSGEQRLTIESSDGNKLVLIIFAEGVTTKITFQKL